MTGHIQGSTVPSNDGRRGQICSIRSRVGTTFSDAGNLPFAKVDDENAGEGELLGVDT